MANVTVIGAQWGDEGKGKIVDWLASRADAVVRFQGGHNAGHTLVVGEQVYKLSLLPSGIVRGTLSIIGNGVVLDPWALQSEIAKLESQGVTISTENFAIADNCPLILPIHRDLDGLREAAAGAGKWSPQKHFAGGMAKQLVEHFREPNRRFTELTGIPTDDWNLGPTKYVKPEGQ